MRPLFNKPSWASTQDDSSVAHFYQRSQQTYADIIAKDQRLRMKETSNDSDASDIENREAIKRRRITPSARDAPTSEILNSDRYANSEVINDNEDVAEFAEVHSTISRNSDAPVGVGLAEAGQLLEVTSQDINNTDSEPNMLFSDSSPVKNGSGQQVSEDTWAVSLGEAKANRVAQGNSLQRLQLHSPAPELLSEDTQGDLAQPSAPEHETQDKSRDSANVSHQEDDDDRIIQILITSNIENTVPLIVRRRMSQRLRDVRLAWCKRQDFDKDMTASVFLAWKGRRLFDVTTCRSLGIQSIVSPQGLWDASDRPGSGEEGMQIHVEAVKDAPVPSPCLRHLSSSTSEPISKAGAASDYDQGGTRDSIRVVLKSPGYDDFRVKVRQNTRISHIVTLFRERWCISEASQLYLLFDGERLGSDSCISDYDIADLDMVDVQVK